jgi:hypothetical protein
MGGNAFYTVVVMIRITLGKGSYCKGEEIAATVFYEFRKPLKARGVYAELECRETKRVEITRHMTQGDYLRQKQLGVAVSSHMRKEKREERKIVHREKKKLCGEGEYSSGEVEVRFTLPYTAHPTSREFGHDKLKHIWILKVRFDVPWGMDKNKEKEVFVEGL